MTSVRFPVLLSAVVLLAASAAAQQPGDQMNARDAFWSASDLAEKPAAKPVPAPTAHSTSTAHKKVPLRVLASKAKVTAPSTSTSTPAPVQDAAAHVPAQTGSVRSGGEQAGGAEFRKVSDAPLGMRYTLLKRMANGGYEEVLPDTSFIKGDHVRVSVMANQPGYLYIIQQGSSGAWTPLYPQAGMPNKLDPGRAYQIPEVGEFTFDGPAGADKLYIVLTRQPIADIDETIIGLRHDQSGSAGLSVASNRINDRFVQQLQGEVLSRDLVFTKVDSDASAKPADSAAASPGESPGSSSETAVYVVNKASVGDLDSKIVVDMTLKHH